MAGTNGGGAIVNIDQLLSPDITFVVDGERWTIKGNIKAREVLTIQSLTNNFDKASTDGNMEGTIDAYSALHDYLVELFKYKRPTLKELPWEFPTVLRITGVILARALGAPTEDLAAAASDPPKPTTSTPRPRSRSTQGSGSARS